MNEKRNTSFKLNPPVSNNALNYFSAAIYNSVSRQVQIALSTHSAVSFSALVTGAV